MAKSLHARADGARATGPEVDLDQKLEQRIRRRAYDLWLADGKPEGSHLRFWKEAEAEILAEDADPGPTEDPTS